MHVLNKSDAGGVSMYAQNKICGRKIVTIIWM